MTNEASYAEAFYDVAKMLGIGARADTPANVWAHEMRPALLAVMATAGRKAAEAGWRTIGSAPRDGTWFFTKAPGGWPYDVARFDLDLGEFVKAGCGFQYVTHWCAPGGEVIAEKMLRLDADTIVHVNAFLTHMAERFRERTARRVLGIRVWVMPREEAMRHALASFDQAVEDMPFGDPAGVWDRGGAHDLVDEELSYWEQ